MPSRVIRRRRSVTTTPRASAPTESLAADVLIGCAKIAAEIGIDERKCFHWLQLGYIPATKIGAIWTSTRSALRAHFSGSQRRGDDVRR
jgi:hypothetical protein